MANVFGMRSVRVLAVVVALSVCLCVVIAVAWSLFSRVGPTVSPGASPIEFAADRAPIQLSDPQPGVSIPRAETRAETRSDPTEVAQFATTQRVTAQSSTVRLHGILSPAHGRDEFAGRVRIGVLDDADVGRWTDCGPGGAYEFSELAPGRYTLRAHSREDGSAEHSVMLLADTRYDLALWLPRVLRVRVVDESGRPSSSHSLSVRVTHEAPQDWADWTGNAALSASGPGVFERRSPHDGDPDLAMIGRVLFRQELPLFVSLVRHEFTVATQRIEANAEVVEFALRSDDPRAADGGLVLRAVDATTSEPLENVSAQAIAAGSIFGINQSNAVRDGVCKLDGLLPGTYSVSIRAEGRGTERRAVRVEPGAILDLGDVPLGPGMWISGRVLNARGDGLQCSVLIGACEPNGRLENAPEVGVPPQTFADGSFRIEGLTARLHRLQAVGCEPSAAVCVSVVDLRSGPLEDVVLRVSEGIPFFVDAQKTFSLGRSAAIFDAAGFLVLEQKLQGSKLLTRLAPGAYTVQFSNSPHDPSPRTEAFEIVRDPVTIPWR